MRVMVGINGASQHFGATHSLAQGQEQARFAKSIRAFLSSSVAVIKHSFVEHIVHSKEFYETWSY